uniref:Ovule protein n=1 Tax=Macrostomum lignano TaxID=282301 RepID=A0A1I8HBD2_9PLAT
MPPIYSSQSMNGSSKSLTNNHQQLSDRAHLMQPPPPPPPLYPMEHHEHQLLQPDLLACHQLHEQPHQTGYFCPEPSTAAASMEQPFYYQNQPQN